MCGLRTRLRTDVDPPRVELPSSRRPRGDYLFLVEIVQSLQVIGDVINRADKEKQQLKIEVEQAKEQLENVVKAKVRKFQQQLRQIAIIWS